MKTNYKIAAAVLGGFALGVSAAASIQAQISAPYYGVGEIAVRDEDGYKNNFIPKSQELIKAAGGKLIAGGFNKTEVIIGQPPANRLVIYSYPNKAAWDKLWAGHLKDVIDDGAKYATFRIFGVEGVEMK